MSTTGAAKVSAKRSAYRPAGTLADVAKSATDGRDARNYRRHRAAVRMGYAKPSRQPIREPLHEWKSKALERFEKRLPVGSWVRIADGGRIGQVVRIETMDSIHVRFGNITQSHRAEEIEPTPVHPNDTNNLLIK